MGFLTNVAVAQNSEAEVSARLIGKPLYLRGFWADDKLKFDSDGKLEGNSSTVPFTEAAIDVDSVKLKGKRLEIAGRRIALEFESGGNVRRVVASTKPSKDNMKLEIEGGVSGDFSHALDAIFAEDLASLVPTLPAYWQDYASKHFMQAGVSNDEKSTMERARILPQANTIVPDTNLPAGDAEQVPKQTTVTIGVNDKRPVHVGGSVEPPKALKTVDPSFTPFARAQKFSGHVLVYFWVEKDGAVSHVKIATPAGLGLDEAAIAAVQKYQFSPAMRNGRPVTVELYVEVNFQTLHQ
jgi:TonB family protein